MTKLLLSAALLCFVPLAASAEGEPPIVETCQRLPVPNSNAFYWNDPDCAVRMSDSRSAPVKFLPPDTEEPGDDDDDGPGDGDGDDDEGPGDGDDDEPTDPGDDVGDDPEPCKKKCGPKPPKGPKPGHGHGDGNHEHSGPPGQA